MYRLAIINIDDFIFTLQDNDNNIYKKAIHFINTKYLPKLGDFITIQEDILNENNIYTFGNIYDKTKDDIIKIETSNNVLYLQRYYG